VAAEDIQKIVHMAMYQYTPFFLKTDQMEIFCRVALAIKIYSAILIINN